MILLLAGKTLSLFLQSFTLFEMLVGRFDTSSKNKTILICLNSTLQGIGNFFVLDLINWISPALIHAFQRNGSGGR